MTAWNIVYMDKPSYFRFVLTQNQFKSFVSNIASIDHSWLDIFTSISITRLFLFGLVTYYVINALYNIFFHPLAKYPGPWWAKVSELHYLISHVSAGQTYNESMELHQKYGPVVRISPNLLSINSFAAYKTIYGGNQLPPTNDKPFPGTFDAKKLTFKKGKCYEGFGKPVNVFTVTDMHEHARLRKIINPGFASGNLKGQEEVVLKHVGVMSREIKKWVEKEKSEKEVRKGMNLGGLLKMAFYDVIGELVLGEDMGAVRKGRLPTVVDSIPTLFFQAFIIGQLGLHPLLNFVTQTNYHLKNTFRRKSLRSSEHTLRRSKRNRLQDLVTGAEALPPKKNGDILTPILTSIPESKRQSKQSIVELTSLMLGITAAGGETTATALKAALYFVLSHPRVHRKLKQEIRNTFPSLPKDPEMFFGDLTEEDRSKINQLQYLTAVLQESLRILPPVSMGMHRIIPSSGATIPTNNGAIKLPADVEVTVPAYVVTHSEQNFVEPEKFIPERWLGGGFQGDNREASQPFSLGKMSCIGIKIAWMEMKWAIVGMVGGWELELGDGWEWSEKKGLGVAEELARRSKHRVLWEIGGYGVEVRKVEA